MVSDVDRAKRALVTLLKRLAALWFSLYIAWGGGHEGPTDVNITCHLSSGPAKTNHTKVQIFLLWLSVLTQNYVCLVSAENGSAGHMTTN